MRFFFIVITFVCIFVLAATIGTLVVGTKSFEGLVVEKPYETGLAWDETQQRKMRLGWRVVLQGAPFMIGRNELFIEAFDRSGRQLADAVVNIKISRLSTGAYDKAYQTIRRMDGRYHTSVDLPLYGNWDVIIDVVRDKERVSFKNAIYAEEGPGRSARAAVGNANNTGCDIQRGPCFQETGDGTRVEFDIQPKPVAAMTELTFIINLTRGGKPVTGASSVVLDLSMPGMFMGKNRPVLKRVDTGRYEGKGVIVRCMSNSRTWQAEVVVERGKINSVVDFAFEVN